MIKTILLLVVGAALCGPLPAEARRTSKIKVEPALEVELQAVLNATVGLHRAFFSRDEAEVDVALRDVLMRISRAEQKSVLSPENQTHLVKILEASRGHLEMGQVQAGSERNTSLQGAFRQLVQLARAYKLGDYKIFFCSKDRTVWLQKGGKAQNPFNPDKFKDCGRIAN